MIDKIMIGLTCDPRPEDARSPLRTGRAQKDHEVMNSSPATTGQTAPRARIADFPEGGRRWRQVLRQADCSVPQRYQMSARQKARTRSARAIANELRDEERTGESAIMRRSVKPRP